MRVIFVHHSCFVVEVDEKVLIFDWFAGDRIEGMTFHGEIPSYEPDTPVYVFASHKHRDHFDMDVLKWAEGKACDRGKCERRNAAFHGRRRRVLC